MSFKIHFANRMQTEVFPKIVKKFRTMWVATRTIFYTINVNYIIFNSYASDVITK